MADASDWVSAIGAAASSVAAWRVWLLTKEYVNWTKRLVEINNETLIAQKRPNLTLVPYRKELISPSRPITHIVNLSQFPVFILGLKNGSTQLLLENPDGIQGSVCWNRLLEAGKSCEVKSLTESGIYWFFFDQNNQDVQITFQYGPTGEQIHSLTMPLGVSGKAKMMF
jgi:hypothetical protein